MTRLIGFCNNILDFLCKFNHKITLKFKDWIISKARFVASSLKVSLFLRSHPELWNSWECSLSCICLLFFSPPSCTLSQCNQTRPFPATMAVFGVCVTGKIW